MVIAAITAACLVGMGAVALADGIQGDTDALATSSPSANGLDATQDVGTSHQYNYSAFITNTGNSAFDVFAASGDTVNATIAVTQNDLSWPASLSVGSFQFTAYDQNKAGLLNVTVPTGTADGTLNHIKVTISATASNGQNMNPDAVVLNYNITAHEAACSPAYTVDFLPPFDDSTPSKLITNTMKLGRTVPVKATILDLCTGDYVTDPNTNVTIKVVTGSFSPPATDAVESYSDAGASSGNTQSFRWTGDSSVAGGGFWIFDLDSSGKGFGLTLNTCYRIDIYINGSTLVTGTDWALLKAIK
jgi:hypothetical protein